MKVDLVEMQNSFIVSYSNEGSDVSKHFLKTNPLAESEAKAFAESVARSEEQNHFLHFPPEAIKRAMKAVGITELVTPQQLIAQVDKVYQSTENIAKRFEAVSKALGQMWPNAHFWPHEDQKWFLNETRRYQKIAQAQQAARAADKDSVCDK
jgi:phosphopantetheinyl transferase (holo-ACP synthase)